MINKDSGGNEHARRTFLKGVAATSFVISTQSAYGAVVNRNSQSIHRIKGAVRRDETIFRLRGGTGSFAMTWAADGRQFASMVDGWATSEHPKKIYHARMLTVAGGPQNPVVADIASYPDMLVVPDEKEMASFWGGACLALDGRVYQSLVTTNHAWQKGDGTLWPGLLMVGSKLIYSPDNGAAWRNQNGSAPVVWEKWEARSRDNMAFFNEEPKGAFASLSFLQMGRNYELNKDGYVYIYSPNGCEDGTMNQLVMFRVPKMRILDRPSYEFFSGLNSDGSANWTRSLSDRTVMHTFPRGWVNKPVIGETPNAWAPSIVYNGALGVYMMASWGTSCSPEGGWYAKPSYLGIWLASTPWGPFKQIHEELAWTPGGDQKARAFATQISPKWIAADGKSFWLSWGDYQYKGATGEEDNPDSGFMKDGKNITDKAEYARFFEEWTLKYQRYPSFNVQRVDLIVE
jgi:hypothetical protein